MAQEERQTSTQVHWHLVARGGDLIALVYPGMRLGEDVSGCFSLEPADALVELGVEQDYFTVRVLPRAGEPEAPPVYVNSATRIHVRFPNESFVIDPRWAMDQSGAEVSETIEIQVRPRPPALRDVSAKSNHWRRTGLSRLGNLLPSAAASSTDYVFGGLAVALVLTITAVLLISETTPETTQASPTPETTQAPPTPNAVVRPAGVAVEQTPSSDPADVEPLVVQPAPVAAELRIEAEPEPVEAAPESIESAAEVAAPSNGGAMAAQSARAEAVITSEQALNPEPVQVLSQDIETDIVPEASADAAQPVRAAQPLRAEADGLTAALDSVEATTSSDVVAQEQTPLQVGAIEAEAPVTEAIAVAEEAAEIPDVADAFAVAEETAAAADLIQISAPPEVSDSIQEPEVTQMVGGPELIQVPGTASPALLGEGGPATLTPLPIPSQTPVGAASGLEPANLAAAPALASGQLGAAADVPAAGRNEFTADSAEADFAQIIAAPDVVAGSGTQPMLASLVGPPAPNDPVEELLDAPAAETPAPPVPETEPEDGGSNLYPYSDLTVVRQRPPIFPRTAPDGENGFVDLEFTVDQRGRVEDLEVRGDPPAYFARSALNAVSKWRFRPVVVDGERVPVRTRLRLTFRGS